MHVQVRGNVLFDGIEEVAELTGAMPLLGLADDFACSGIERGEEAGCAVTRVIVGSPLDLAGAHGQQRRGAIQRLYLALFIHAQDQRAIWRRKIEANDVAHLLDEQRIAAEPEGLTAVRSERKGAPDAAYRGLAESTSLGHVARGPVRCRLRLSLQRPPQHLLDLTVAELARGSGTRFIEQAIETEVQEALTPLASRRLGTTLPAGDLLVGHAVCG